MKRVLAATGAALAVVAASCGGSAGGSGTVGPTTQDHWHAAYGIYVCDKFLTPIQNVHDIDGIHTHGDGVIHIHPFNSHVTGLNANLGAFGKAAGLTIADDHLASPEFPTVTAGQDCSGKPVRLQVAVWDAPGSPTPRIVTTGLASVAITHDRMVITIAAVPEGTTIPKPTWTDNLDALTDVTVPTTAPPPAETIAGDTPCPKTDGSSPKIIQFAKAPPMCIDHTKQYRATVTTTVGSFTVDLDAAHAPTAVNVFVTLARYHTYDATGLSTIQIAANKTGIFFSGGDPVGVPAGTGGPGFTFKAELPKTNAVYKRGAFGFLITTTGVSGSQFYAVTAPDLSTTLKTPSLPVLGTWSDPGGTIDKVDARGTTSGNVFDPVTVTSITITETG